MGLGGTCKCGQVECWMCDGQGQSPLVIDECDEVNGVRRIPKNETGWVIERHHNSVLQYWTGEGEDKWSNDSANALRFARFEDGQKIISRFLNGIGNCTEHMWCKP